MTEKQSGFSLTEVLVGLVFLAIGLLAIASLQGTSIRGNKFSNNLMQATYVGQDGLEFLKTLPLNSADLQAGDHNPGSTVLGGITFNRSYTVVINGNLRTIRYTVTWNDGINHTVNFSTIRSQ